MPNVPDDDDDDDEEEAYHPSDPGSPSDDAPSPSASDGSNDNSSNDGSGDEDAGGDAAAGEDAGDGGGHPQAITATHMQRELLKAQHKTNQLLLALVQQPAPAPAPAPAPVPVQQPRHARAGGGGGRVRNEVPPITELGKPGGRYETGFSDWRGAVLTRLLKANFMEFAGNTTKSYSLNDLASHACLALRYTGGDADVLTMRTNMRKALGALAREANSIISTNARDYFHQVHPQLPMRVARGREDYGARVKEHATLYARLVDVVGGPDGGFDINGADRFYWDFCSKVVNGCTLSMCKVATC